MRGEGIVPVMDVNGNNGGFGNGWGDSAWIIIFLIFALGGWGNNGFGGNNGTNGALTRGDLCQDMNFNDLQNAVRSSAAENNSNFRGVDNAVCTLGYQTAQLANGIDMNIANGFSRLDTSLCQSFNNVAQQVNQLSREQSDCCCTLREAISGVNYNLAMNTNQLQNALCSSTRDVIENANNNTRAILDFLTNDKITTLQAENQNLKLAASQERQNNYLINELKPCPIPAYITCNPNQSYPYGFNGFGGCGCNNI